MEVSYYTYATTVFHKNSCGITGERIRGRSLVFSNKPKFNDLFLLIYMSCTSCRYEIVFYYLQNNFRFTTCTKNVNQKRIDLAIEKKKCYINGAKIPV